LSARILIEEHQLYAQAIQLVLDGRHRCQGKRYIPSA
jgi:folate-dependent phosphoribosylglycinamide formyltransferase PurN